MDLGRRRKGVYRSGHCGIGRHYACTKVYGKTTCQCPCHTDERTSR